MTHKKIIKREDGSRVKIEVEVYVPYGIYGGIKYTTSVYLSKPDKRKFINVVDTNDYDYRKQSFPKGRNEWVSRKMLQFVTFDEIYQAQIELWNKLKPTL